MDRRVRPEPVPAAARAPGCSAPPSPPCPVTADLVSRCASRWQRILGRPAAYDTRGRGAGHCRRGSWPRWWRRAARRDARGRRGPPRRRADLPWRAAVAPPRHASTRGPPALPGRGAGGLVDHDLAVSTVAVRTAPPRARPSLRHRLHRPFSDGGPAARSASALAYDVLGEWSGGPAPRRGRAPAAGRALPASTTACTPRRSARLDAARAAREGRRRRGRRRCHAAPDGGQRLRRTSTWRSPPWPTRRGCPGRGRGRLLDRRSGRCGRHALEETTRPAPVPGQGHCHGAPPRRNPAVDLLQTSADRPSAAHLHRPLRPALLHRCPAPSDDAAQRCRKGVDGRPVPDVRSRSRQKRREHRQAPARIKDGEGRHGHQEQGADERSANPSRPRSQGPSADDGGAAGARHEVARRHPDATGAPGTHDGRHTAWCAGRRVRSGPARCRPGVGVEPSPAEVRGRRWWRHRQERPRRRERWRHLAQAGCRARWAAPEPSAEPRGPPVAGTRAGRTARRSVHPRWSTHQSGSPSRSAPARRSGLRREPTWWATPSRTAATSPSRSGPWLGRGAGVEEPVENDPAERGPRGAAARDGVAHHRLGDADGAHGHHEDADDHGRETGEGVATPTGEGLVRDRVDCAVDAPVPGPRGREARPTPPSAGAARASRLPAVRREWA